MEKELRDNYLAFINNSKDFYYIIDKDFKITFANEAYKTYFKILSGEEIKLGVNVFENSFDKEYQVKWREYYRKAFNEQLDQVIESVYNPESQKVDYALIKFNTYRNDEGEVEQLHCFATILKSSTFKGQEKLTNELNIGTNILATISPSGHILFITKNISQWGFEQKEMIGQPLSALVSKEQIPKVQKVLEESFNQNHDQCFELKVELENKTYHWEWLISPDLEAKTLHVEIIDRTASVETKRQLEIFDKAVNHSSEAILVNKILSLEDPSPKIIYANPAFEKLSGYSFEEVEGKSPYILFREGSDHKILSGLAEKLKQGDIVEFEAPHYTKDQKEFWVQVKVTPVFNESGELESTVSIIKDVTKEKNQKLQIELTDSISEIVANEQNLNKALKAVAKVIAAKLSFDFIEIWLPDQQQGTISKITEIYRGKVGEEFLAATAKRSSFEFSEGLPGQVWQKKKELIWSDLGKKEEFIRNNEAKNAGLKTMMAIPLLFSNEVTAVMTAGSGKELIELSYSHQILKKIQQDLSTKLYWKKITAELRMTFQYTPQLIGILDLEGTFLKINQKGLELMERAKEEVIGKNLAQSLPSLVYDEQSNFIEQLNDDSPDYEFTTRHVIKDGKIRWMNWTCQLEIQKELIFITARDISYEKKMEELLDDATSLSKIGGWEIDMINESVFWSDMVYEIHEEDPETFTPNLEDGIYFYREDYRAMIREVINEAVSKGNHIDYEAPIITKKGNEVWVRTIGKPEFIGEKCIRIWGSFQDITEEKRNQFRLKEAFEERNNLLGSIADIFVAFDNEWKVLFWNEQAEEIFNQNAEDILGKNLWEVYPEYQESIFYKKYHEAKKIGQPVNFENYLEEFGIWADVTAYPSDEGLSVIFKDITLKKKADERLEAANERFRKITEATADAIWDWDIAAKKSFLGKGFKSLIGAAEIKDSSKSLWKSSLHPEDKQEVLNSVKQSINDPTAERWEQQYRLIDQQQNIKEVMDQGLIIRDQKGKAIRMLGAISDITYIKKHEKELQSLNESLEEKLRELEIAYEELERFTYIASHDLQEPLRMVASFLNQLEKNYASDLDERAKKYIHFAKDGSKRMKKIILDLLEYSRAGNFKKGIEEVSMEELLEDYKTLRRQTIVEKEAEIIYDKLPKLQVIKVGMEQVLFNLIDNALKYVADGVRPKVHIEVQEEEHRWVVSVRDNGMGIDEEYFDKIFIIFQRLHDHDVFEGTGVGLSIVKKTVESWGGQIWVESTKDQGSCFYFTINKPNE